MELAGSRSQSAENGGLYLLLSCKPLGSIWGINLVFLCRLLFELPSALPSLLTKSVWASPAVTLSVFWSLATHNSDSKSSFSAVPKSGGIDGHPSTGKHFCSWPGPDLNPMRKKLSWPDLVALFYHSNSIFSYLPFLIDVIFKAVLGLQKNYVGDTEFACTSPHGFPYHCTSMVYLLQPINQD